ncbi:cholesterol 25-hydroxylase-like protein [Genypterus blacodes]|uniref:cholesterol 25-hydroxylase-like protein n=1 Tax=Genypterus blacodes TaxID=154954 RepID=UPI003F7620C8
MENSTHTQLLLQGLWDCMGARQSLLTSPLFPVCFSLTVYLGCCLPYICLDLLSLKVPVIRRFKIQPQSKLTWAMVWSCTSNVLFNHFCFIFPLSALHLYWRDVVPPALAPEVYAVVRDIFACLLLFDTQYFVWHLLHHKVPWLYKTFHKEHHHFTATFSMSTDNASVWETLSLSFFSVVTPALLGCHPLTEMLFFILHIFLSVEAHSGYDFPWSPHRVVPFGLYGGAPHHDLHHLKFRVNYAPYFTHWDKLFGTLHGEETETEPKRKRKTL